MTSCPSRKRFTGGQGSSVKRFLEGQPVLAVKSANWNRTFGTVKVVPDVHIGFQLPEIGQDLDERPLVVSQIGPGVVVFWNAPQYHLAVDRAGPAYHLASRHRHRLSLLWAAPGLKRPVVRGIGGGGGRGVAEF